MRTGLPERVLRREQRVGDVGANHRDLLADADLRRRGRTGRARSPGRGSPASCQVVPVIDAFSILRPPAIDIGAGLSVRGVHRPRRRRAVRRISASSGESEGCAAVAPAVRGVRRGLARRPAQSGRYRSQRCERCSAGVERPHRPARRRPGRWWPRPRQSPARQGSREADGRAGPAPPCLIASMSHPCRDAQEHRSGLDARFAPCVPTSESKSH